MTNLYTVHDKFGEEYAPPFTAQSHGFAIRSFRRLLTSDGIVPEEYELIHLGSFDSKTAMIYLQSEPVVVDIPPDAKTEK